MHRWEEEDWKRILNQLLIVFTWKLIIIDDWYRERHKILEYNNIEVNTLWIEVVISKFYTKPLAFHFWI